jgi:hypothetical protein
MTAAGTFALDTNTYLTSSGVSGMTATQVPIAATATTVTSSMALAGSGAGITTGPTSSTSGDLMSFTGTAGQAADSGIAASNVPLLNAANTFTNTGNTSFAGNVGIGTTGPLSKLDFGTSADNAKIIVGTYMAGASSEWTGIGMDSSTAGIRIAGDPSLDTFPIADFGYYSADANHNWTNLVRVQQNGNVGIGTTSPGAKLNVYDVDANLYNKTGMDVNVAYGNPGGGKTTTALSIGVPNLGTNTNSLTSYGLYIDDIYSYYGLNSPTDNDNFGLYVKGGANNYIQGNVSIGDTTATSMFNVGTANQFQVTSTGVSSAGAGSTDLNGSGVPEVHCLADGSGGGVCGTSTPAFSAITSATNTTASMVVGTGGSLGVSGSGTISANVLAGNGVTNTAITSLGTGSLVPGSCINGGASAVTGTTASSVVTASLSATAAVMLAAPAQGIVVTALLSTDTHVPFFYVCDTTLTSWTYTGYSVAMQVH